MTTWLKKRFEGRMGRKEFLLPGLFFVVLPVLLLFALLLGIIARILPVPIMFFSTLFFLPFIIKRLHDIGLSGWFSLISLLATPTTFYYFVVPKSLFMGAKEIPLYMLLILFITFMISMLFLLLKSGSKTVNKYGRIPLYKKSKTRILFWVIFTLSICTIIVFHKFLILIASLLWYAPSSF